MVLNPVSRKPNKCSYVTSPPEWMITCGSRVSKFWSTFENAKLYPVYGVAHSHSCFLTFIPIAQPWGGGPTIGDSSSSVVGVASEASLYQWESRPKIADHLSAIFYIVQITNWRVASPFVSPIYFSSWRLVYRTFTLSKYTQQQSGVLACASEQPSENRDEEP